MALVLKIVFTSLLVCTSLGAEINVSFELKDSDVNEVIFVNERDILLRCCVSGVLIEYMIRIARTNRDDILPSVQNATCKNCLEYIIKEASLNDGGEYTCNVSYIGSDGSMETKTKMLNLNVHNGTKTKCFRNGTSGQPYQVNDLVLMSCYCWETDETRPCMWIAGIPGSPFLPVTNTFETVSRSSKKIQRLLLQVGSESLSLNMIHICRSSSLADNLCLIGPQSQSSTDVVINSHDENTFTNSRDCELLRTPTVTSQELVTQAVITRQSTAHTEELTPALVTRQTTSRQSTASTSGFNVIVLGVGVLVGLGVALVLIGISRVVFILLKRRNKEKKEANTGGNPFYANKLYSMNSNDQQSQDITDRNESADSHYYGIDSNGAEPPPVEHDSKTRDSVEPNTYMRTIAYM